MAKDYPQRDSEFNDELIEYRSRRAIDGGRIIHKETDDCEGLPARPPQRSRPYKRRQKYPTQSRLGRDIAKQNESKDKGVL